MKLKEIMNTYGDYEINEEELDKLLAEPKTKSAWELEVEDIYWVIDNNGHIIRSRWIDIIADKARREIGNVYLTKEETEFELERRKIEAILLKYGTRNMMSLSDTSVAKHQIIYDHGIDNLSVIEVCDFDHQGGIYFATKKLAEKAIDEIGKERLKKYCFYAE